MPTLEKSKLTAALLSVLLGVTACGGSDDNTPSNNTPTNSAPTDITLSESVVLENAAGATVGTLTATDADENDTFTFTVDDERFEITDDATLKLADGATLDFDAGTGGAASVTVNVTVTDSGSESFSKAITLNVTDELDYYEFASKDPAAVAGESSVRYGGQTGRHLLINDLNALINTQFGDVDAFLNSQTYADKQAVIDALLTYFEVPEGVYETLNILTETDPSAQTTYVDVSSGYKNIVGKLAGNDVTGQHKHWEGTALDDDGTPDPNNIVDGAFAGWGAVGSTTPELLVRSFFDALGDNAQTALDGDARTDPFGNPITSLYITEDGRDLKQLIHKFLLMGVTYSQGADDYLDNDIENQGLLSDNVEFSSSHDTSLEHKFDEGFGYFGAARDYLDYTDDEIAGKGGDADRKTYHDANGDGEIDFHSEFNFGQSTNAAKRDRGATTGTVDLTADAMNAFLAARKIINDAAGSALTDAQMEALVGHRDDALLAWEKAIAATVVHYINDTTTDLNALRTDDFDFSDLAKHWSEMKGFALGLQFNPKSQVSDESFVTLHALIKDAPVVADSGDDTVAAYLEDLKAARDLLQEAYEFDAADVAEW